MPQSPHLGAAAVQAEPGRLAVAEAAGAGAPAAALVGAGPRLHGLAMAADEALVALAPRGARRRLVREATLRASTRANEMQQQGALYSVTLCNVHSGVWVEAGSRALKVGACWSGGA